MRIDTKAFSQPEFLRVIDILHEFGGLLLSEKSKTADRSEFGDQSRSAEEASKPEDLPRLDSTPKGGNRE